MYVTGGSGAALLMYLFMSVNYRIGGVLWMKLKSWLVVCVQSNREKKTYERLKALGYDSFLPLQEETTSLE